MGARVIFAMAILNVPFIIDDPTRGWNWASLVFGLGIASAVRQ